MSAQKKWWKSTEVIVALISGIFLLGAAIINVSMNSKKGGLIQNQSNSPSGIQVGIQTGEKSSVNISGSFNPTTINQTSVNNYGPRTAFLRPDDETLRLIQGGVALFHERHPTASIRVEVENGSTARGEVATIMGSILQAHHAGTFWASLNIEVAPGAPITIFHAKDESKLASMAESIFRPYVQGKTAVIEDVRLPKESVRFYLNGAVTFSTNGLALLE